MRILVTFTPSDHDARILADAGKGHDLVYASSGAKVAGAEVILGHPDPVELMASESVRWVHLTSAGYTPYDRDDLRQRFRDRGAMLTNSSEVYAEPCAEHALMFMLSHARAFPSALLNQSGPKQWPQGSVRASSCLLKGETVLIAGFGAIGKRLAELLAPLTKNVCAVRRSVRGDEPIETRRIEDLLEILPRAKHVLNTLPENPSTRGLFDARAFSRMSRGAIFYNVGRGSTVDQDALVAALRSGSIGAAYLDVCTPEPLPPDHPLWTTPNCFVTPHSAGGHAGESERLVRHFVDNLRRFEQSATLVDRVY
jgi:phosphoglycerate dehydrogenase-like enzyme